MFLYVIICLEKGKDMTSADVMLNRAKKDFVLRQLESTKVQKNFGPMFCYLKPALLTMIDLYGPQISMENLQQCLDAKVRINYKKDALISGATRFANFKNLNMETSFQKPAIRLFIDNATETPNLGEFFDNFFDNKPTIKNINVSKDESQLDVIYKFIHELCHTAGFRNVQIKKNGLPQPLSSYGTVIAKDGTLCVDKCGLYHEEYKIGDNGKVKNYCNQTPLQCFPMLDEGVNEIITMQIANSPQFKKYLKEDNIKSVPKQKNQIYPRFLAAVNLFEVMYGPELREAHFAGGEKIVNAEAVRSFGNFCDKLNNLEERIYINSSILYNGVNNNKQSDIVWGNRELKKDFEELDHLLFDFLDANDTIMRCKQFNDKQKELPKEYKKAVSLFVKSFDTMYNFVMPVYPDAQKSKDSLQFWGNDKQSNKEPTL